MTPKAPSEDRLDRQRSHRSTCKIRKLCTGVRSWKQIFEGAYASGSASRPNRLGILILQTALAIGEDPTCFAVARRPNRTDTVFQPSRNGVSGQQRTFPKRAPELSGKRCLVVRAYRDSKSVTPSEHRQCPVVWLLW